VVSAGGRAVRKDRTVAIPAQVSAGRQSVGRWAVEKLTGNRLNKDA
jgi:hypothetical protein